MPPDPLPLGGSRQLTGSLGSERLDPGVVFDRHRSRTIVDEGDDVLVPVEKLRELDGQELIPPCVDALCVRWSSGMNLPRRVSHLLLNRKEKHVDGDFPAHTHVRVEDRVGALRRIVGADALATHAPDLLFE